MAQRGTGTIINVASIAAYIPVPGGNTYGTSKTFLKMFSEVLYMELKDKGIRVQALCPGFIPTDFYRNFSEKDYKKYSGLLPIIPAEVIIDYSLKCLKKNKPVCIMGTSYKALCTFMPLIPRSLYYRLAARMMAG